ncbi:hypothetical protein AALB39_28810 [Lachnospiraceae bacterium 54-53]
MPPYFNKVMAPVSAGITKAGREMFRVKQKRRPAVPSVRPGGRTCTYTAKAPCISNFSQVSGRSAKNEIQFLKFQPLGSCFRQRTPAWTAAGGKAAGGESVEEKEYYQMVNWIDERMDEMQGLLNSGHESGSRLPGCLENYYKGKLQAYSEARTMITYVREGTLNQLTVTREWP